MTEVLDTVLPFINWTLWAICVAAVVVVVWLAVLATLTLAVRMGIAFALDGADVREQIARLMSGGQRTRISPLARMRADRKAFDRDP